MYAFTSAMQEAWSEIFDGFHYRLPHPYNRPYDVRFDAEDESLSDINLFLGHTCGYPFIKKWHRSHAPICVPKFAVNGCDGIQYSSWLVTHVDNEKSRLVEFKGSVAVINNQYSNSGMNVFRHAVAKVASAETFFSKVEVSGSHLESMNMVIQGEADIAAIDAVTYQFAVEQNLVSFSKLKIIGQSQKTTGLPFIVRRNLKLGSDFIVTALNASLENMSSIQRSFLKIYRFAPVVARDFHSIRELELRSQQAGYPELR